MVGSGPAGAACALRLARAGVATMLLDHRSFPREKLCGEYLNYGAVAELTELGVAPELASVVSPLRGMRLFAHGERAAFAFTSPAWSIPRAVLDERLRNAALRAGAVPVEGRLRRLTLVTLGVVLHVEDASGERSDIHARYVIGADGMHSAVARLCNLTLPERHAPFAIGGHHDAIPLEGWIEMYTSPRGYLALNPVDAEHANAVVVMDRAQLAHARGRLGDEIVRFSHELSGGARVLQDSRFHGRRSAIGPLDHRTVRPIYDRVLLVGDAANFVDPFTGQGIFLALLGARHAAAAVAKALANPYARRRAWEQYAHTLARSVAERKRIALMMRLLSQGRSIARRAASALRSRPEDFAFLIDAVCARVTSESPVDLIHAVGRVLR